MGVPRFPGAAGLLRLSVLALGVLLVPLAAVSPASAVCVTNGRSCGASIPSNDRRCCPGSICGPWGNVCQPGCRIGGVAYRAGTINPANVCQVCQPRSSTSTWSSVSNGTSCDDGNACTQTDTCQSGVCTGTNPVVCEASDPCHMAGTCDPSTGACSDPPQPNGTACSDGNVCTQPDTCQSGVCTGTIQEVCCGDGDIDAGEACDDGNVNDGDWCSSTCVETMVSVYAGGNMSCSLLATHDAVCWGQNSSGQLGIASFSLTAHGDEAGERPGEAGKFVTLPDDALTINEMSIGFAHACAILSDNNLYCWGAGLNGQLGLAANDTKNTMTLPVALGGIDVVGVGAGGNHTCALLANGEVWCWGLNSSGELGLGTNANQNKPTAAVNFSGVAAVKVVTGAAHTCALLESNEVYCWGDNSSGQLGDNNGGVDSNVPSKVTLVLGDVTDLDAGGLFTCATVAGNVYCWGENGSGQLGNNDGTNTDLDVPSAKLDIDNEFALKLALGGEHGCVLTGTGKVYCWGESDAGQTGQNDVTDDLAPAEVIFTADRVLDVAAGNDHTCVVLLPDDLNDVSRPIQCWGEGGVGQLGLGNTSDIGDDEVVDNDNFHVDVVSIPPVAP